MSYITAIETATPQYCHQKKDIVRFFQNSTDNENIRRKIKMVAQKSGIETRYSVLKDFSLNCEDFTFFEKTPTLEPEPGLSARMKVFKTEALKLSLEAVTKIKRFDEIKSGITHIITVTCTGLFAPGLDTELVQALNLSPAVQRNSVNFMGCNAAIIAMRQAHHICSGDATATVLVVCTELCTLHFRKIYNADYILSTSLFGDGSAAVLISSNINKANDYVPLKINGFNSLLISAGVQEMAWELSEKAFIMQLGSYVSELINGAMPQMLADISINKNEIDLWAIHPGGKKILDNFVKTLAIDPEQLKDSYQILKNFGNMSSATVLFVIKSVIENNKNSIGGTKLFSAAFGPGLSVETMTASYV